MHSFSMMSHTSPAAAKGYELYIGHKTYKLANVCKMSVTGLSNTSVLQNSLRQALKINPVHYTGGRKQDTVHF